MKKTVKKISSPDELNKTLQYTSPFTWIILGISILVLAAFFSWASLYKLKVKISGSAFINDKHVALVIDESKKSKLKEGQKVIINNIEGSIVSFDNNGPVISEFDLSDGNYNYTIILDEIRPIEFLFNKK